MLELALYSLRFRAAFAGILLLGSVNASIAQATPLSEPTAERAAALATLEQAIEQARHLADELNIGVSFPATEAAEKARSQVTGLSGQLEALTANDHLHLHEQADAERQLAKLHILLAHNFHQLAQLSPNDESFGVSVIQAAKAGVNFADSCIAKIAEVLKHDSQNYTPERAQWIAGQRMQDQMNYYAALGNAVLYESTEDELYSNATLYRWGMVSPDYKSDFPPHALLAGVVAPIREVPSQLWILNAVCGAIGLALLLLVIGAVIYFEINKPGPLGAFTQFVLRSTLAIALAAVAAGVFPALADSVLSIKMTLSSYVTITAGGAAAVFIVIYLLNPPRLLVQQVQSGNNGSATKDSFSNGDSPQNLVEPTNESQYENPS